MTDRLKPNNEHETPHDGNSSPDPRAARHRADAPDSGNADLMAKAPCETGAFDGIPRATHTQTLPEDQYSPFLGADPSGYAAANTDETDEPKSIQPPRPTTSSRSRAIYRQITAHCQPFRLDAPWQEFSTPDTYHGVAEADAALAILREQFSDSELQTAGVLTPEGGLHPGLVGPEAIVVALREESDTLPFDLMTVDGCVSGEIAAIAVLNDVVGKARGEDETSIESMQVHVAFSMKGVVVLRAVGLRAASVEDLANLRRDQLRRFMNLFGTAMDAAAMVVHDWNPSTLSGSAAPQLAEFRRFFEKVQVHLDLRTEYTIEFHPTEDLITSLKYVLEYGDAESVRKLLKNACAGDEMTTGFVEPCLELPASEPSPADNTTKHAPAQASSNAETTHQATSPVQGGDKATLQHARALGVVTCTIPNREERRTKRKERDAVFEDQVLVPLRAKALAMPDPVQRNATLMMANVSSLHHRQATNLIERSAIHADTASSIPLPPEILPAKDLQAFAALTNCQIKLMQAVSKDARPNAAGQKGRAKRKAR